MTDSRENDRRARPDRREGKERRDGRDRRHAADRRTARRLPDEYAQTAGGPQDRMVVLVNRHWPSRAQRERSQLTKALMPLLEELARPGVPVTERHRDRCEEVVVSWLNGQLSAVATE